MFNPTCISSIDFTVSSFYCSLILLAVLRLNSCRRLTVCTARSQVATDNCRPRTLKHMPPKYPSRNRTMTSLLRYTACVSVCVCVCVCSPTLSQRMAAPVPSACHLTVPPSRKAAKFMCQRETSGSAYELLDRKPACVCVRVCQ